MHVLVPGASMDSSAGLRDSDSHAIRGADLYDQLRRSGCSISDTLITPLLKSQALSKPHLKCSQPNFTGCELHIFQLPGSPPGISYAVRFSYHSTFLVLHSLLKIETERRREGK